MEGQQQSLREVYAQYFFSVIDASAHQDDAGRRRAQQHLEESLDEVAPAADESAPAYAW